MLLISWHLRKDQLKISLEPMVVDFDVVGIKLGNTAFIFIKSNINLTYIRVATDLENWEKSWNFKVRKNLKKLGKYI